jgi:hypothetical protein
MSHELASLRQEIQRKEKSRQGYEEKIKEFVGIMGELEREIKKKSEDV